jgi:hypothetical protein
MDYRELDAIAKRALADWKDNRPGLLATVRHLIIMGFTPVAIQYRLHAMGYDDVDAARGCFLATWLIS